MPSKTFHEYWLAITVLEAHEMKSDIKSNTFSDMKKTDRGKLSRDLDSIDRKLIDRPRESSFDYEAALKALEASNGD